MNCRTFSRNPRPEEKATTTATTDAWFRPDKTRVSVRPAGDFGDVRVPPKVTGALHSEVSGAGDILKLMAVYRECEPVTLSRNSLVKFWCQNQFTFVFQNGMEIQLISYEYCYSEPRNGELRTQTLKSHLVRRQSLNVLPSKPGVGQ